jgi:F-type H+-transporting ATPase subunit epsilon
MQIFIGKVGETLYDGEAYSLTVPGVAGEMTILGGHMPLVTTLKAGTVRLHVTKDSEPQEFAVEDGVLEVTGDGARVLL